jgi:hypothetical protein
VTPKDRESDQQWADRGGKAMQRRMQFLEQRGLPLEGVVPPPEALPPGKAGAKASPKRAAAKRASGESKKSGARKSAAKKKSAPKKSSRKRKG